MSQPGLTPFPDVLRRLIAEQLSAVVFVQDYLQLHFDGLHLTLNLWPIVRATGRELRFGDERYRDELCAFIGEQVRQVAQTETTIEVLFTNGSLVVDVTTKSDRERLIAEDTTTNDWAWW